MSVLDDTDFDTLHAGMNTRVDRQAKTRTRRHRLVAGAAALVVVLGATGGAYAVMRAPQQVLNYTTLCYPSAKITSVYAIATDAVATDPGNDHFNSDPTTLKERIAHALELCEPSWKQNTWDPKADHSGKTVYPIPPLQVCQLSDARLAVFPSSKPAAELCPSLGLDVPHR